MSRPSMAELSAARDELIRRGWDVRPPQSSELQHADLDERFERLYKRCGPYTMTSLERTFALYQAVDYVARAGVPGDVVECGVWRAGSCMLAARVLMEAGETDRGIWLYDTFAGMTEPRARDRAVSGQSAKERWDELQADERKWCYASLQEARENMFSTGYPAKRVHFVEGPVEETIPAAAPQRISLLRLDTDWYESTRHELIHLYPRLSTGGVLILDDYGHWLGSKDAVDEYFAQSGESMLLNRVDYAGRIGVKPAPR